jgi:PRC-barrel domain
MTGVGSLRYIDAAHVLSPAGEFSNFRVRDAADHALGTLSGFVVDPAARRLRYLVVEMRGWLKRQRYLVPLCGARLERDRQALMLEVDEQTPKQWREFDDRQFSPFSDDDLLDAMFARKRADDLADTHPQV